MANIEDVKRELVRRELEKRRAQQPPQQQDQTIQQQAHQFFATGGETLMQGVGGAAGDIVGGFLGTLNQITGGDLEESVKIIDDVGKDILQILMKKYLGEKEYELSKFLKKNSHNEVAIEITPQNLFYYDYSARMRGVF